ncbi:hypothetical protein [Hyalangium minutum]|uniref:Lipoprotein n=1 Tax=Hyalangium minutum TaxID=394096 RepID=A0A085WCP1_9BACT|nr:hypothetical protein [Hyalangium minutum]KFE65454.1 hypothetical protein DB31_1570 [Hyalangium minutum]
MKWMGAWAALALCLAGCGESATNVDLDGVAHASVSYGDGMSFSTRYTFALSERVLLGKWSQNGPGPGYRSEEDSRSLSEAEAAQLQELVNAIHISEPSQSGQCWEDTASLSFQLTDTTGTERRYPTDPERQRCNNTKLFAEKDDVQAFLDGCRALLPEKEL